MPELSERRIKVKTMNYITLINQFWKTRRSKRITSLQADLYMFLIQECNEQDWENPFQCPNTRICASIGITEKSLIDARNRLQQLGLLDTEKGITKQRPPTYYLLEYWNTVSNRGGNRGGNQGGNRGGNPVYSINKPNQTKRKPNSDSKESGASGINLNENQERKKDSAQKKKEDSTPHWKAMVEEWFVFYRTKSIGGTDPTFEGKESAALKKIADRLKSLSAKHEGTKNQEWTEDYAIKIFHHFLIKAWADKWRSENFMLHILNSHFDAITQTDERKTTTSGKIGSLAGAFAKIDSMPG